MNLHHEVIGTGHPIVLVHGWGSNARQNWVDTGWVEALAPLRQVVLLDVRGHGLSDKPHALEAYTYGAMSADVLAVMDELGIERADYAGYSMGAFMGAWLLAFHPHRFTAMVLGGIGDETTDSEAAAIQIAEALRAPDPASITDPLGIAYRSFVDRDPTNDREALAVSALAMWPDGHPRQLADRLARTEVPTLIVNGSDDLPYALTGADLAALIPGGRYVEIEGADHLTAVPDPRTRAVVVDFLAGLG